MHQGFAFGSSTRGPFVRHLFTLRFIEALPSARPPAAPSYATFSPAGSSRLCLRLGDPRPLRTPPFHPQVHQGFAFGSSQATHTATSGSHTAILGTHRSRRSTFRHSQSPTTTTDNPTPSFNHSPHTFPFSFVKRRTSTPTLPHSRRNVRHNPAYRCFPPATHYPPLRPRSTCSNPHQHPRRTAHNPTLGTTHHITPRIATPHSLLTTHPPMPSRTLVPKTCRVAHNSAQ